MDFRRFPCLFLGFLINQRVDLAEITSSASYSLYVNEKGPYLSELRLGDLFYLGKFIKGSTTIESLNLLEANIYSILKKISPETSWHQFPLILLGVWKKEIS